MTAPAPATRSAADGELRAAWAAEHSAARLERAQGHHAAEWAHLERAHILSQPMAGPHVRTHLGMLGYGIRRRSAGEIAGQLLRLAVAAPGSWTGRYPRGNTGGSNVSALKPLPVPKDLQAVLKAHHGVISNDVVIEPL
jgi:hypothetical protein